KKYIKQREFAWHVVLYNINRKIILGSNGDNQKLIFCLIFIWAIPDGAQTHYLRIQLFRVV
ncbi:MAG: hypothetical protein KJ718_02830, partial [Nanoarchaeota archaeon]|nr:hypothetical protein [Nanoarchaeota archaeon]